MESIMTDLRLALRGAVKNPGFTVVVVLTLALGVGATTAIFSVVDAVLLTPLPYEDPDRLIMVREGSGFSRQIPVSPEELLTLRERATTVTAIEAFDMVDWNVLSDQGPERAPGARVTPGFFEMLGVTAHRGRLFDASLYREDKTADQDNNAAAAAVVLSHGYWQRRFGGSDDAIGQTLTMSWNANFGPDRHLGQTFTIAGVLPPDFLSPMSGPRDLWVSARFEQPALQSHYLFPFARLREDATPEQTAAEMGAILQAMERTAEDAVAHEGELDATVVLLPERSVSRVKTALWALLGAVGFVLLIACVNVANLLLARSASRQREVAVRVALGAGSGRLTRQLFTEALLLATLGTAVGLGLARAGVAVLVALQPTAVPRLGEIAIDGRVFAFTVILTFLTAIVFGLLPARATFRESLTPRLRDGTRGTDGGSRLRAALVVVEVALAVVLLVGSGLLIRSFAHLQEVDLGLDAERVLSFELALPSLGYGERHRQEAFHAAALERLAALPGVESVAVVNNLPLGVLTTAMGFDIVGRPAAEGERRHAAYRSVSPGYFKTLGIPLLAGEPLAWEDLPRGQDADGEDLRATVVLINRTLAERFFPDGDALGAQITSAPDRPPVRIAGIVGDVRSTGPAREIRPRIYFPGLRGRSKGYLLRVADGDPTVSPALQAAVERTIQSIDPEQPIHGVRSLATSADGWVSRPRFNAFLLTLFAALALVLSAVGIFGVLSFSVSRRRRELGVRMALGADRGDVVGLVVREGMRLATAGLVVGLALALALVRLLTSLLHGVSPQDPTTYAVISGALLAVAFVAVALPARRATLVEPVVALREE